MKPRKAIRDPFGNTLLPRMYYKHGSYYLVTPANKWVRLSDKFGEAVHRYASEIAPNRAESMPALIEAWRRDILPGFAEKTQADYGRMLDRISESFFEFRVQQVGPNHVYDFCKQWADKPRSANMYRSLLVTLFKFGASTDWPNANPAQTSMRFKEKPPRDRYLTDAEVQKIKYGALSASDGLDNRSGEMVCAFIDLALATAQRVSDLLALTWDDVTDEGIYFRPAKTVNSTGVRMLIEMTPKLTEILDRCGRGSEYVIHRQDGGQITYTGIHSAWRRACLRAKVKNAHIHDLRAKALTDLPDAKHAQTLAGHATESMTSHYRKARMVTKVKGVEY